MPSPISVFLCLQSQDETQTVSFTAGLINMRKFLTFAFLVLITWANFNCFVSFSLRPLALYFMLMFFKSSMGKEFRPDSS